MGILADNAPQANLNGNAVEDLTQQCRDIYEATCSLQELMSHSDLKHGRNFQLNPEDQAPFRREWLEIQIVLQSITSDIMEIARQLNK